MPNRIYAVIDTNVLVSALLSSTPNNNPLLVLANVYLGRIVPVFNCEILAEYREVLSREKFHLDQETIDEALHTILLYGLNMERVEVPGEFFPDPKDIVFYEVKMSKEGAYLVTGNIKHFPSNPLVVTPKEMVEILSRD